MNISSHHFLPSREGIKNVERSSIP
jgi:hypothetical protein